MASTSAPRRLRSTCTPTSEDYGRAGLQMLPVVDPNGSMTARQMVSYCLALLPVSLMPALFQQAGWFYAIGAVLLGAYFTKAALGFWRESNRATAPSVLCRIPRHASITV